MEIRLVLPLPPSLNHYYGRRGRHSFITSEGKQFRARVRGYLLCKKLKTLRGRLALDITIHQKNRIRQDLDNKLKALLDALQSGGLFEDDSQIDELRIVRGRVKKGGECVVVCRVIEEKTLTLESGPR